MAFTFTKRKKEILKALLEMLAQPSVKITTSGLAKNVDISESALYKHFSSKSHIYSILIQFLSKGFKIKIDKIIKDGDNYLLIMHDMALEYITFISSDKGIARLFLLTHLEQEGKGLVDEMLLIIKYFEDCLSLQMEEMEKETNVTTSIKQSSTVHLIMSYLQGSILNFTYSKDNNNTKLIKEFEEHWKELSKIIFIIK